MGKLEQHTDLITYPSNGMRREYRRTVYSDGMVIYDRITETANYYGSVELTEDRYHAELSKAMEWQRKGRKVRESHVIRTAIGCIRI